MEIKKIAILGAGTMGQGIAWALALAGKEVVLYDIKQEFCDRAIGTISKALAKAEEKGKVTAGTKDAVISRIQGTGNFEDVAGVDFVIECVFENMDVKKEVYTKLDKMLRPDQQALEDQGVQMLKRSDKTAGGLFLAGKRTRT